jgi:Leucine-rich repeat (LRR) protein
MSRPKYDTREKLQKHIDNFFSQNPTLTHILLGDMGITSIEGIKFPKDITYLPLSHNQITSLEGVEFPPNLSTLQVPMNNITSLDGVAFSPKLTDLQLQQNQITSLDGIVFPPGLISLDLSNNKITSFKGMQFPLSLFSLKLAGNPIDVRTVSELKNPSPFVIREIVAAFPETGPHFQRMEEEKEEKVEQLFKMLYALNMKKEGGTKRDRKTCRKMKKRV